MTNEELKSLMRLSTVLRWDIVDMMRTQSVAEHSFRVALLAEYMYDLLYPTPHNSFEKTATIMWALKHDAEEVFTGDTPSTIKDVLGTAVVDKMKREVLERHFPSVANLERGAKGAVPYYVVKIADIVEALLFLEQYCVDDVHHEENVRGYLHNALTQATITAQIAMPTADWARTGEWLIEMIYPVVPVVVSGSWDLKVALRPIIVNGKPTKP